MGMGVAFELLTGIMAWEWELHAARAKKSPVLLKSMP